MEAHSSGQWSIWGLGMHTLQANMRVALTVGSSSIPRMAPRASPGPVPGMVLAQPLLWLWE